MALFERITGDNNNIAVHTFFAAVDLWSNGDITRSDVVSAFSLTAADEVELDALKSTYDGIGSAANKARYVSRVHSTFILGESNLLTESQAKTILGY